MPITSLAFAGFVAAVLIVYHLLPGRAKQLWLLAASFVFYALWDWRFGLILLGLTMVNFWLGKQLPEAEHKAWLAGGIGLNLLVLVLFKYQNFYIAGLSRLLGDVGLGALSLLVPVGFSFYLVQVIAYFLDLNQKRIEPESDLVLFTLYLYYFPKLLSGPIERARTFIPKLAAPKTVDSDLLVESGSLIVVGLVRKLVIADSLLALMPETAFTTPGEFAAQHLAAWLLGYAFALYNDFAGYTNIVRGVSGLFGIQLSQNFMRPYFSRDFTEFWKRWHISLSEWLRDYIFFPTTRRLLRSYRNRKHIINLVVPPMATMLVSGMWHGLSWQMLVWGGLHGLYQVLERVINLRWPPAAPEQQKAWRRGLCVLVVFVLAVVAWLPFRMDLPTAWVYLTNLLSPGQWADPQLRRAASDLIHGAGFWAWPSYNLPDPRVFLVILPSLWLDWRQEVKGDELFFLRWGKWGQALVLLAAILLLILVSGSDAQVPFVYQGF
ncbi:MAG: MBOAT family protein [Anaerolineales bacterium]|nr:MBOAT family protein [Anaerolineales bacterium]